MSAPKKRAKWWRKQGEEPEPMSFRGPDGTTALLERIDGVLADVAETVPGWRVAQWHLGHHNDGVDGWHGDKTIFEDFTDEGAARQRAHDLLLNKQRDLPPRTLQDVMLYPVVIYPNPEGDQ